VENKVIPELKSYRSNEKKSSLVSFKRLFLPFYEAFHRLNWASSTLFHTFSLPKSHLNHTFSFDFCSLERGDYLV
jgi:hypothetical protein